MYKFNKVYHNFLIKNHTLFQTFYLTQKGHLIKHKNNASNSLALWNYDTQH